MKLFLWKGTGVRVCAPEQHPPGLSTWGGAQVASVVPPDTQYSIAWQLTLSAHSHRAGASSLIQEGS